VAVKGCVPPVGTVADGGAIETAIPVTVMVAGADAAGSVTEVAVSVTVKFPTICVVGAV